MEIAELSRPSLVFQDRRATKGNSQLKKQLLQALREAELDRDHLTILAYGDHPVEGSLERKEKNNEFIRDCVRKLNAICVPPTW